MNLDSPSPYVVKVMFEIPDTWYNWLSCLYHHCPYSHAWMLMYNRDSKTYRILELTEEGISYETFKETEWNLAEDERLMLTTLSFSFEVDDDQWFSMLIRASAIKDLPLFWSNWFVFNYFISDFPSLTCCSFLSYIIDGDITHLPVELLDKLVYAYALGEL